MHTQKKTKDAIEKGLLMTEDTVWDIEETGKKAEFKLRTRWEDILTKNVVS